MTATRRTCCRLLAAGLALGVTAALFAADPAPPAKAPEPREDPFPIRRVVLPPDKVAAELERVRSGALVRLPRAEFERKIRAAAASPAPPPHLIEAHYRARLLRDRLDENALEGTAEWKLTHRGNGPGVLPVPDLQIALRQARWTDNRPAVIGLLESGPQAGLGILVEKPGEQSLLLDWSSRGVPEAGEMRFDLAVPAIPVATIELAIPVTLAPTFPQDEVAVVSVSEPDDGNQRTWRVAFGGLTHLEMLLRPVAAEGVTPVLEVTSRGRQDLGAGLLTFHSTLDFRALRGGATALQIEHDPDLTVSDVEAPNLESWRPLPGLVRGRKRLAVKLSDPTASGQVRVTATAALPASEATTWTSPQMLLTDSIVTSDSVRIRKGADVSFVELRPGTYRLTRSEFADDRSQTLTFDSSLLPDGQTSPARPAARLRSSGTEFRVQQETRWDLAERSTLSSRIDLEVVRGALTQLNLRVPPGWDLDGSESESGALAVQEPRAGQTIRVEFPQALAAGGTMSLRLRLHSRRPLAELPARLTAPLPDVTPLGATSRRGVYAMAVSPAFRVTAPFLEESDLVGPPHPRLGAGPTLSLSFIGAPPTDPVVIERVPPLLNWSGDAVIVVAGGQCRVTATFNLSAVSGASSSFTLINSRPVETIGTLRVVEGDNRVVSVEPLPVDAVAVIAGHAPLLSAGMLTDAVGSRAWRVRLAKPIVGKTVVECRTTIETAGRHEFDVPLPEIAGSAAAARLIAIDLRDSNWKLRSAGMSREYHRSAGAAPQPTTFRITDPQPRLWFVDAKSDTTAMLAAIEIDAARLTAVYVPGEPNRCHYRFGARSGQGAPALLEMPPDSKLLAVRVDGQAIPYEALQTIQQSDKSLLRIPLPAKSEWQGVELLYTVPGDTSSGLTPIRPPLPTAYPSPKLTTVEWRLPPDHLPMQITGEWRQVDSRQTRDRLEWPLRVLGDSSDGWQGRTAPETMSKLNPPVSPVRTFRQMLIGGGPAERPLLDAVALAEAGVGQQTPVTGGTFESLGLIVVPVPGGSVLTTPRHHSLWSVASGTTFRLAPGTANLLQEAMRAGRDSTGRFRTIDDWLLSSAETPDSLFAQLGGDEPGWTAWRSTGANPAQEIRIVDTNHLLILGWLIALAVGLVSLWWMGRPRIIVAVALLILAAAGAAAVALPGPLRQLAIGPFVGAAVVIVAMLLRPRPADAEPLTVVRKRAATASGVRSPSGVGLAGLLILAMSSAAVAPEPAKVYLLTGPKGDLATGAVLASPDLIEQLNALAKQALPLADSAFLRATYTGKADGDTAEVEALLDIALFADEATVPLPLGDVRLREVLVDGAAAFPKANGNERFAIEVKGKGDHRVQVKFTAAITGSDADRDLRFQTPECPVCRLAIAVPAGVEQVRAVNWRGAQAYSGANRTLSADLGRTHTVQVRWRVQGSEESPTVRVSEVSVWDLDPTADRLRAVFDYRITKGNVATLRAQLPPGLQVSRVDVRPETAPVGGPPVWVRDWTAADNVLKVELQNALAGNVRLLIDAIAVRPMTARPALLAPRALGVLEGDSMFAYRLRGLAVVNDGETRGVVGVTTNSFMKDWLRPLGVEKSPATVTRAYRREKGQTAYLRPVLQVAPAATSTRQELAWSVNPRAAILRATTSWAGDAALTFGSWEVPATVAVHDVDGPAVHSWLRSGDRVFAWYREPTRDPAITWQASMPAPGTTFDAPVVRADGVGITTTEVSLRVPEGWVAWPDGSGKNGPAEGPDAAVTLNAPSAVRFQVRRPQPDGAFRVATTARVVDRQLLVEALVEPTLRRDRPHSFVLALMDADGWESSVADPTSCAARPLTGMADRREWQVDVPVRDRGNASVRLVFRRPLDGRQDVRLPQIAIHAGAPATVRQSLKLVGPELRGVDLPGWQPVAGPVSATTGTVWHSDAPSTRATVAAAPYPLESAPGVEIALLDVAAAEVAGRRVYRAAVEFSHQPGAALEGVLPIGSRLEGAALEGNRLEIGPGDRVQVPLPADGGPRSLQLVWSSDRIQLEMPRFESGGRVLTPRTVLRSAFTPGPAPAVPGKETSAAYQHLLRADALVKLADEAEMKETDRRRLVARAGRWVRLAQANLGGPRSSAWGDERSSAGSTLAEWAGKLRERTSPNEGGRPAPAATPPRDDSWQLLPYGDLFRTGVPSRWVGGQVVALQPSAGGTLFVPVAAAALFAAGVGLLGLLIVIAGRHARPEQIVLLGVLGAIAVGPPIGYLFLAAAALAVAVRVAWFGRAFHRWATG